MAGLAAHKKGRGCQKIKITVSCFGRCISTVSQRASKTKSECSPEPKQLQMPLFALPYDAKGSKYSLHCVLHTPPCHCFAVVVMLLRLLLKIQFHFSNFDFIALSKSLWRN